MYKPVVCIGGALVDELLYATNNMMLRTTNVVAAKKSAGGVGRNIAHQLAVLNIPVHLISVFGEDADGEWLKQICTKAGVELGASITAPVITGKYTGIIDKGGSLFTALLTNAAEHLITPDYLQQHTALLQSASYLLIDTNLTAETIAWIIEFSNENNIPLIIEPVSVGPAKRLSGLDLNGVYLISPNEDELPAMCNEVHATLEDEIAEMISRGVQNIWLHRGAEGSVLYNKKQAIALHAPKATVIDCTGAGDASVSAFIMSKVLGKTDIESLQVAHTLAAEVLTINGAIASHINQQHLLQLVSKYYAI